MLISPVFIVIISMFVQTTLTFWIMIIMGRRRFEAAREGNLKKEDFKTMQLNHAPEAVLLASRNFENQFEVPVLFFVVALLALHLNNAGWFFAISSLLFVVTRIAHSIVHITNNHIKTRFRLFLIGCGLVFLQWLSLLVTLI
ncbi:hypothetical protein PSECIP111951_00266 [Pseudoalteromonas holothuriae]|uniref:MAPEG family protein n=1 Tax=Pseudoalteromonas holothuriae TaxID=2963714 RepID=A0A9W4R0Q1_9GAMM|nr:MULTISPECIES: MAPEG family protein [unclassified Pseudoalteromonas]CAH9050793.1 hypothetical protein PSECIP111951_00266 [Pseudoalteromonas sp. CIP111951]CAH9061452.1 hypothetical protein PSECIP111854_02814 [Pseudoalteromonas sp. CIP111854]